MAHFKHLLGHEHTETITSGCRRWVVEMSRLYSFFSCQLWNTSFALRVQSLSFRVFFASFQTCHADSEAHDTKPQSQGTINLWNRRKLQLFNYRNTTLSSRMWYYYRGENNLFSKKLAGWSGMILNCSSCWTRTRKRQETRDWWKS